MHTSISIFTTRIKHTAAIPELAVSAFDLTEATAQDEDENEKKDDHDSRYTNH